MKSGSQVAQRTRSSSRDYRLALSEKEGTSVATELDGRLRGASSAAEDSGGHFSPDIAVASAARQCSFEGSLSRVNRRRRRLRDSKKVEEEKGATTRRRKRLRAVTVEPLCVVRTEKIKAVCER